MSTESGAWVGVENNTVVNVKAQLGYTAFLPCSVRMIGDKQVSLCVWERLYTNVCVWTFDTERLCVNVCILMFAGERFFFAERLFNAVVYFWDLDNRFRDFFYN